MVTFLPPKHEKYNKKDNKDNYRSVTAPAMIPKFEFLGGVFEFPIGLNLLETRVTKNLKTILYVRLKNIILSLKACIGIWWTI